MADKKLPEYCSELFYEEMQKRIAVPREQVLQFLELWKLQKFGRNEFIMRSGEIPKFSIFVVKGCLRQYTVNEKGEESIVYFAEERHLIGDLPSMRSKSTSSFNFQALEKCELLTISAENWEESFIKFPWWGVAHVNGYQKWTAKLQQQIADMQTQSGEERYLKLLKERPALLQRVPQHYIASYLGLSAETLSRIRKKIAGL
jgi:CRP-like cAMP-binding protein